MRFETGYEREGSRIEMTPLMDVVFLLLVFFIYAVARMTTVSAISVALPEARGNEKPGKHEIITLCEDGSTWLNDQRVEPDRVIDALSGKDKSKPVLIRVDRNVPIWKGLSLLSDLQKAEWKSVAFQTSLPTRPESAPPLQTRTRVP